MGDAVDNRKAKYDPANLLKPNLGKTADPTDYQAKLKAKAAAKPKKQDKSRSPWLIVFKPVAQPSWTDRYRNKIIVQGWLNTDGTRYTIRNGNDLIVFEASKFDVLYIVRTKKKAS